MARKKAMTAVVTHEDSLVVVDKDTGEVVDITSNKTIKYKSGAHYLKVFTDHPLFKSTMPHSTRTLLFALADMTPYASLPSQNIYLSGSIAKKLGEDYELGASSIKAGLKWLIEHEAVRRVERGVYQVNPYLYARGPSRDVLRLQREWDSTAQLPEQS